MSSILDMKEYNQDQALITKEQPPPPYSISSNVVSRRTRYVIMCNYSCCIYGILSLCNFVNSAICYEKDIPDIPSI